MFETFFDFIYVFIVELFIVLLNTQNISSSQYICCLNKFLIFLTNIKLFFKVIVIGRRACQILYCRPSQVSMWNKPVIIKQRPLSVRLAVIKSDSDSTRHQNQTIDTIRTHLATWIPNVRLPSPSRTIRSTGQRTALTNRKANQAVFICISKNQLCNRVRSMPKRQINSPISCFWTLTTWD